NGWHAIDLSPEELAPLVEDLRRRVAAAGRAPGDVAVTVPKGILPLATAPDPPHALYGMPETIRADVAAYAAAGCDYPVLTLRRAADADALEAALDDVAHILSAGAAA